MSSSFNSNDIRAAIGRVCASPNLENATRLQRLLRFLADSTLAEEPLKETLIGVRVFERAPDYDPKSDSVVRTEVRRLRLKLHEFYAREGAAEPIRIEIPKGGYSLRFERIGPAAEQPAPAPPRRRHWRVAAAVAMLLAGAFLAGRWLNLRSAAASEVVAVLPFQSDERSSSFAADLTGQITDSLSRAPGLRVISQSSVQRTASGDPMARAAALHARYIVTGSIERPDSQVRVRVLKEPGDHALIVREYDLRASDLSGQIATGVASSIGSRPSVPLAHTEARVPRAQSLFVEGRRLWGTREQPNLLKSVELFQEGAELEPDYVWNYVGLADSYNVLGSNDMANPLEFFQKAEVAARRAVALSPELAEAHASLGFAFYCQWNWKGAERELNEARRLNPNLSIALFRSALLLCAFGRFDDALRTLEDEEVIDPFSPFAADAIFEINYYKRDRRAAVAAAREAQRRIPGRAFEFRIASLALDDKPGEALTALREWRQSGGDPAELDVVEITIRATKDMMGARTQLENLLRAGRMNKSHKNLACLLASVGEDKAALDELEKALAGRETDLVSVQWEPACDRLRGDPRYKRVIRALGLPSSKTI
ncbi:MAG TPA: hypothetical protein VKU01_22290 [Bryobacteraceae bacterium]|nr:hypothetical protein [Bryobacteraceae bacterium]